MPNNEDSEQPKLPLDPETTGEAAALPPVVPPKTSAPFTFNQQVNIQQIPPKVWDKLSAEQVVDLTKTILDTVERVDKRHFEYAMEQAQQSGVSYRRAVAVGGAIAAGGVAAPI